MQKIYILLCVLFLFGLFSFNLNAQPPCSGTPETNTIVSASGSHTVCAGTSASLSLVNTYTNSGITYQWHLSMVSGAGPYSAIAGATLSAYTSPTLSVNTYYYRLVVTCLNSGLTYTIDYPVYVISCAPPCTGTPGANSVMPTTHTVCAGDVASMSLATTYTDSGIAYQWESSNSQSGPFTPISGANASTYTSGALTSNMYYNVIITCTNSNLSYTATHSVAVTSCTYCSGIPGTNTVVPTTQTLCEGSAATLSLANTYTASGFSYQWQTSTVSAAGPFTLSPTATLSSYTSPTLTSGTYYFRVVITCTNSGQSFATGAVVTVLSCTTPCSGTPGANTILPAFHTICPGDIANMSLANTYTNGGITYQWGSSASSGGPYTTIPGATLSTYTSSALSTTMYYNIVITCTNSSLTFTTDHAVTVVPCTYCSGMPGSNTITPLSHTVCEGNSATMNLANSYTASGMTHQWGSSSVSIAGPFSPIPGATLSTYVSPALTTNMYYNVVITCTNSGLSFSTTHAVTIVSCTPVGIAKTLTAQTEILIYPNPTSGEFIIESKENVSGILTLIDLVGKIVLSTPYSAGENTVSIKHLPKGMYYARLESAKTTRVVKIIKQ